LDIGFIDHLRIVTTSNYNSLTGLHTSNITVNYSTHKVFSSQHDFQLTPGWRPFHTKFLVFFSQPDFRLSTLATDWLSQTVPVITSLYGPHRKPFFCWLYHRCVLVFRGSHVIATQTAHWWVGARLSTAVCLICFAVVAYSILISPHLPSPTPKR
jgi:hypothetical protein